MPKLKLPDRYKYNETTDEEFDENYRILRKKLHKGIKRYTKSDKKIIKIEGRKENRTKWLKNWLHKFETKQARADTETLVKILRYFYEARTPQSQMAIANVLHHQRYLHYHQDDEDMTNGVSQSSLWNSMFTYLSNYDGEIRWDIDTIVRDGYHFPFPPNGYGVACGLFAMNIKIQYLVYESEYYFEHINQDICNIMFSKRDLEWMNDNINGGKRNEVISYIRNKLEDNILRTRTPTELNKLVDKTKKEKKRKGEKYNKSNDEPYDGVPNDDYLPIPFSFPVDKFNHLIRDAMNNYSERIDPLNEYFQQYVDAIYESKKIQRWLARRKKNNDFLIENILTTLFNIDPKFMATEQNREYLRFASRLPFLSLMHRNLNPGCEIHIHLHLASPGSTEGEGQIGHGKSTFVRSIFPSDIAEYYFTDQMDLGSANRETIAQNLSQFCLFELAESGGSKKTERDFFKQVTTTSRVMDRRYYTDRRVYRPARHVFIFTSNEQYPIKYDPSGGRRIAPVIIIGIPKMTQLEIEEFFEKHRDIIMLEAAYMYLRQDKYPVHIQAGDGIYETLQALNDKYTHIPFRDKKEHEIMAILLDLDFDDYEDGITATELLNLVPMIPFKEYYNARSLGYVLRHFQREYGILESKRRHNVTYWYPGSKYKQFQTFDHSTKRRAEKFGF